MSQSQNHNVIESVIETDVTPLVENVTQGVTQRNLEAEVHQKTEKLINSIKVRLTQSDLDEEIQKELAELLNLLPQLRGIDNPYLIDLADVAISNLLAEKDDATIQHKKTPGDVSTGLWKRISSLSKPKSNHHNLQLVRKIHRELEGEVTCYRSPFFAIFKVSGTQYTKLISGLIWFVIAFVLFPYYSISLIVAVQSGIESYSERTELQEKISQLEDEQIKLKTENQRLKQEMQGMESKIAASETPSASALVIPSSLGNRLETSGEIAANPSPSVSTPNNSSQETENTDNLTASEQAEEEPELIILVLLVTVAGALGSAISVIVRYEDLIARKRIEPLSLFFTGFFKPVVGMSFAIFLVATLESGIISIGVVEETKKVYLYVALAFVAGFSERLVQDILIKTEQRITGSWGEDLVEAEQQAREK